MSAGGAETFLMKVYRALDKSKYQMDFAVATDQKCFYDDEIIKMGGKIYPITPKSKSVFGNFKDIVRLVKAKGYKAVLRTSQHSLSALELFAARLGGAKKLTYRSSNSNTVSGSKKQRLLHKVFLFMPRFFANVRIAPSTEAAEFMFGKNCVSRGKATILNNGIDYDVYKFDPETRAEYRKMLAVDDGCLLAGHVGRFNLQKNHKFLLEVFAEIKAKKQNAKLLLVGEGELESEIRQKAKELGIEADVIFFGVSPDVPKLLSAMDIYLFPSFYEGMPNTVIEAQAAGLPCLISDTVTREANISGKVVYKSIEATPAEWAETALSLKREDCGALTDGYSIKAVAEAFVKLVF